LTRGEAVTKEKIKHFINGLDVSETTKAKLLSISPHNYKGVFPPL
jgi:hypothetical protein